ncbi:MAG: 4Fe-4S dicluster domain-containing protein [Candidatus Cloacimonetes bacterium]|nr:4Fe-4S dicluster domain-containing protein [Candidatus Cloacimonadota bacterium]
MIAIKKKTCTGCGICRGVCPMGVIALHESKANITDEISCLECGACSLNCPVQAIELTKGTGCLVAVLKEDILKIAPKGTGCMCEGKKGCGC